MRSNRRLALALTALAALGITRADAAAPPRQTVVWYATLNAPSLATLADAFAAAHPEITLRTLQLSSGALPPRILLEARGNPTADVVECDDVAFTQLRDARAVAAYRSPEDAHFLADAVDAGGYGTALWLDTTVIAWNPERLRTDGLPEPRSFADFAQPRWRGKFGVYAGAVNWYLALVQGGHDGDALAERIAANAPIVATSHAGVVTQLAVGELDATPTAYGYYVADQRAKGRPLAFVAPNPLPVTRNPVGILASAPHPAAARVLVDWLLSEAGQRVVVERIHHVSARNGIRNDPAIWNARAPHLVVHVPRGNALAAAGARFRRLFLSITAR